MWSIFLAFLWQFFIHTALFLDGVLNHRSALCTFGLPISIFPLAILSSHGHFFGWGVTHSLALCTLEFSICGDNSLFEMIFKGIFLVIFSHQKQNFFSKTLVLCIMTHRYHVLDEKLAEAHSFAEGDEAIRPYRYAAPIWFVEYAHALSVYV